MAAAAACARAPCDGAVLALHRYVGCGHPRWRSVQRSAPGALLVSEASAWRAAPLPGIPHLRPGNPTSGQETPHLPPACRHVVAAQTPPPAWREGLALLAVVRALLLRPAGAPARLRALLHDVAARQGSESPGVLDF
jgi:hypothetical protein